MLRLAIGPSPVESIRRRRHWGLPLQRSVNGAVIASFAIVWGVSGLLFKKISCHNAVMIGGGSAVASMIFLIAATRIHSLPLLSVSVLSAGLGYGLLFFGGLSFVSDRVEVRHKGLSLSMMYFAGYSMQGSASIALGVAASRFGLSGAVTFGATIIAIISALTALSAGRLLNRESRRKPRHEEPPLEDLRPRISQR
jgi:MFS family permease